MLSSQEVETLQSVSTESRGIDSVCIDLCSLEKSHNEAVDVSALINHSDAVIADDHSQGVECSCSDSDGVGCLEVERLEEEREAKRVSDAIDQALELEMQSTRRQRKGETRLLLLGTPAFTRVR